MSRALVVRDTPWAQFLPSFVDAASAIVSCICDHHIGVDSMACVSLIAVSGGVGERRYERHIGANVGALFRLGDTCKNIRSRCL